MPRLNRCPRCDETKCWVVRGDALKCVSCGKERPAHPARIVPGFAFDRGTWLHLIDTYLRDGTGTALAMECRISRRCAYKVTMKIQEAMMEGRA